MWPFRIKNCPALSYSSQFPVTLRACSIMLAVSGMELWTQRNLPRRHLLKVRAVHNNSPELVQVHINHFSIQSEKCRRRGCHQRSCNRNSVLLHYQFNHSNAPYCHTDLRRPFASQPYIIGALFSDSLSDTIAVHILALEAQTNRQTT